MAGTNGTSITTTEKRSRKAAPPDIEPDPTTKTTKGKAKPTEKKLEIPLPDIREMEATAISESPLIQHRFGEKQLKQMRDKQQMKAKTAREAKDPQAEYESAMYTIKPGVYGIPATAFKSAMVNACRFVEGIPMTKARGAFFVMGDILEIEDGKPHMREDVVRVGKGLNKVADLRYRPQFDKWKVRLRIRYNAGVISADQVINLLITAGFSIGVGEWRPEKSGGGSFGQFGVQVVRK